MQAMKCNEIDKDTKARATIFYMRLSYNWYEDWSSSS